MKFQPKRFCKHGHDTFVVGRDKKRFCRECDRVASREDRRGSKGEQLRAKQRERYAADPTFRLRMNTASRRWVNGHPLKKAWYGYRGNAKQTGKEFTIPKALFEDLITDNCYYCGKAPSPVNGIDRVENTRGYVEGNVVTACAACNKAKNTMPMSVFISTCQSVSAHQAKFL